MPGLQQIDWSKIHAESDKRLQDQFAQNDKFMENMAAQDDAKLTAFSENPNRGFRIAKKAAKEIGVKLKKPSGGKFSNFMNSSEGKGIVSGISTLSNLISTGTSDPNDPLADQQMTVKNAISDEAIKSGNPIAMAIGAGTKLIDAIGAKTGLNLDNIDKEAGKDAGVSGGLNNAIGYIPGASMLAGLMSGETNEADAITDEVKDISGAYGDSYGELESAQKLSGKRIFGRKKRNKINSFIDEANETNQKMYDISTTNTYRKQSDYGNDLMQQNLNRYAGSNWMNNAIGEHGMKLMSVEQAKYILSMRKAEKESLQTFEDGGKINIIPEGARHSRLNHLDDVNDDFEDVTKKGIPVVTPTEDGDLEQVAEIERTELVINLDLTNEVEELRRKWKETKDEKYLIEAGKLLAEDVVTNTFDPGNQVEEFLCPQN